MVHEEDLLRPAALDDPAKRQELDKMISAVREQPAMEAYFLRDEPSASEFKNLARLVAYITERDNKHLTYINLLPSYSFAGVPKYEEYIRGFIKTVHPQLISYAHYPFLKTADLPEYFLNLAVVRREALAAKLPFMTIIQASDFDHNWRLPTASELRWSVYTSLAYGSKGISYFLYWGPKHFGGLYQDGKSTELLPAAVKLNKEIKALSGVLAPLRSTGVYNTNPIPIGTAQIPGAAPIKISSHGQFTIGLMEDSAGHRYCLLVNRDYKKEQTATIAFRNARLVQELNRSTGKFKKLGDSDWFGRYSIKLAAGDGRLFSY